MPSDLKKLIELGKESYEAEEFDKALDYLLAALDIRDDLADVHNLIGVIYHQQGRLDSARRHFERALELNSRYTDAALNLAVTYNEIGEYEKARSVVANTIGQSGPSDTGLEPFARGKLANMHADLADAYRDFGLLDDAAREYEKAVRLAPDFMDIRTKLAELYREQGRHEEARRELEAVLERRNEYVPAMIALGLVFYSMEKWEEARQQWLRARSIDPDNRQVGLYLTMVDRKLD